MIEYHVYPGGKKRIVTFSYDDGQKPDEKLIALMNKYNVKGTFHINGTELLTKKEELRARYAGHEISCHTVHHGWPSRMPAQSVVFETIENRRVLEEIAGYPVVGMSYPSGSYDDVSVEAMRSCGIVYSRTVKSTATFQLPEDWMRWHPTCHHRDALPLCNRFMEELDSQWTLPLLYIWGHSFEFRTDDDWAYMENVISTIANNEKIWYATNIEIYNYMEAQKQLKISADETLFENPTATDLWVERNKRERLCIPAGSTLRL